MASARNMAASFYHRTREGGAEHRLAQALSSFTLYASFYQDPSMPNRLYFGNNLHVLREHMADESGDAEVGGQGADGACFLASIGLRP